MLKPEIAHFVTASTPVNTHDGQTALIRLNWSIHDAYVTYLIQKRESGWVVVKSELFVFI